MIKTTVFKDAVKSVLRISSSHNKGAQIRIFQPPPRIETYSSLYSLYNSEPEKC